MARPAAATGGDTTAAGGGTGTCEAGTGTVEPIMAEADGAGKTVGLLFDVTGRGDKSFNDGGRRHGQGRRGLRHHDGRV